MSCRIKLLIRSVKTLIPKHASDEFFVFVFTIDNVGLHHSHKFFELLEAMSKARVYPVVIPVEDSNDKSCTPVYRSAYLPDELISNYQEPMANVYDIFRSSVTRFSQNPCLGEREVLENHSNENMCKYGEYKFISYEEVNARALAFGSILMKRNFVPMIKFDDTVTKSAFQIRPLAIMMANSIPWFITDIAASAYGIVLVPFYENFSIENISLLLSRTRASSIVLSYKCLKSVISVMELESKEIAINNIIVSDKELIEDSLIAHAKSMGVDVYMWYDLLELGMQLKGDFVDIAKLNKDDVWSLVTTSGSTGAPKSVVITHGMIVSVVAATDRGGQRQSRKFKIRQSDRHLSYLPLSHILERFLCWQGIITGARLGVYSGNIRRLLEDIKSLKPTVLVCVPRVLQRIYANVMNVVRKQSPMVQKMFNWAMCTKLDRIAKTGDVTHTVIDKFLFSRFRQLLGGNLRFIASGAAPLDETLCMKIEILFSVPILIGYGMTESTGACFIQMGKGFSVGESLPSIEFKIRNIEEMNYLITDPNPRGELLIRGWSVFKEYFRDPTSTANMFTSDGWFCSGDVCELLDDRRIKIIDRAKSIFKLSQGEFVSPEYVEGVYGCTPMIDQIYVHGEATQPMLTAVISIDEAAAVSYCPSEHMSQETKPVPALMKNQTFLIHLKKGIMESGSGLKGYERIHGVIIAAEPFSVENGFLTSTNKLRRQNLKQRYGKLLSDLYASLQSAMQMGEDYNFKEVIIVHECCDYVSGL